MNNTRGVLIGTIIGFLLLFNVSVNGQAPTAINGRTFQMTVSSGSFPFASSGSFRFLPAATDSRYAIVPLSGNIAAGSGTHTYTKLNASTGRLSLVDNDLGSLTANCTFTTPTSGTYSITSPAAPGSSQTGSFVMYSGTSLDTLVGTAITVSITSGAFPFAEFGTYRFRPNLTGNGYVVEALAGDTVGSTGTYSYTKNSTWTGLISFSDSVAGPGMSSHLSFDSATTGSVLLWQAGGTGYQTGLFFVTTLPAIGTHPSNLSKNVGATASFTVAATGSAPLSYQWRKGGQNIPNAIGTTYTIPSVQVGDAANYDVIVSNSAGSATSNPATLTVVVPPVISSHPTGANAVQGTTVNFGVTATGTAPLSYQWKKNGNDINGATLSTYSIPNVQSTDAGNYTARVSNAAGSATSNPATLAVIIPPAISSHPTGLTALQGATVEFGVSATGTAPLLYQWIKNGSDIGGATLSSYSISNVQGSDAGDYSVRVSNAAGPITSNPATLVVDLIATTPPAFASPSWDAATGFSATLQVEPQTRYRIQWTSAFTNWFDLDTIVPTGTSVQVNDPTAKTEPRLFYRAVSP